MPRDARYGAGLSPGCSHRISYESGVVLKVIPGKLRSDQTAIANTLPPTFHTSAPPHWHTQVVAGSAAQKLLNCLWFMPQGGTGSGKRQRQSRSRSSSKRNDYGAAGGVMVAGSQCSSALPSTKRHISNHVVLYFWPLLTGWSYSRGSTTVT